jgi:hypothetical protein
MLKKNKKLDIDKEFETSKITGQKRFSMASSAETKDQRTVKGSLLKMTVLVSNRVR